MNMEEVTQSAEPLLRRTLEFSRRKLHSKFVTEKFTELVLVSLAHKKNHSN